MSNIQFTSGSWTYEAIYKFPLNRTLTSISQSLVQLCTIGLSENQIFLLANCVATSGSNNITLYARPTYNLSDDRFLSMSLNVDVFDGDRWNISFGRFRNDDPSDYLPINEIKSNISSSYFLRAAKSKYGEIDETYYTSTFYQEALEYNLESTFQVLTGTLNPSGTFLSYGDKTLATSNFALNNSTLVSDDVSRTLAFDGKISQIRFWSKGLLLDEWYEHVKNYKNIGVKDPINKFNDVLTQFGSSSFERIRLDASTDQIVTSSDGSGEIILEDFSQNNILLSGSGFEVNTQIINPEVYDFTYISPFFDRASTNNKVRSRGFQNFELAQRYNANFGNTYDIAKNEEPKDDARFTIDFSIINALDQDMVNIFATLELLDNALGSPELSFSPDYKQLEKMRKVYFDRLTDKINLKSFFEFFQWFDRSIGNFISALLPRKTKFRGINFVIESHMLERSKFENLNIKQYLGDLSDSELIDTDAILKKY